MKTIVAHICRRGGKNLNYLFATVFALAIALPSFAADWVTFLTGRRFRFSSVGTSSPSQSQ